MSLTLLSLPPFGQSEGLKLKENGACIEDIIPDN